ncbi:vancomycin high temperature exclusion protein [Actinomyces sp.]|uniref:SanA/YdcF family protein n=1 Tax=Actinomyces sp. TaxID=29317 RepID=UPI0026DC3442|nr:ElyC/SanA/YdcF family protein [Actinomyces sp.]MDO4900599.1 ElyC/SanA/YdcF family protein [Actinomyces sp.]
MWLASAGHVTEHGTADDDATAPVAIVLGASVYSSGEPSPWLRYRLDVAVDLYESGRVDAILVSGDNGQATYNEPIAMHEYLVQAGIPAQAIAVDYAGFDTYATCVRARSVFGVSEAILVSQDFHEPRAVAVCRSVGVQASGVGDGRARANRSTWAYSWLRERGASVKAAWDVVTDRTPMLGDRETGVDEAIAWTRARRNA